MIPYDTMIPAPATGPIGAATVGAGTASGLALGEVTLPSRERTHITHLGKRKKKQLQKCLGRLVGDMLVPRSHYSY